MAKNEVAPDDASATRDEADCRATVEMTRSEAARSATLTIDAADIAGLFAVVVGASFAAEIEARNFPGGRVGIDADEWETRRFVGDRGVVGAPLLAEDLSNPPGKGDCTRER